MTDATNPEAIARGPVERVPCTDTDLIEYVEGRIVYEQGQLDKCNRESAAFMAMTEYDWSPMARQWGRYAEQAAIRLGRWQAIRDIINDRNEWRTQHENLLSVRQSDLAVRTHLETDHD